MNAKAYAKLNLGLAVTAKRADGFHELETLFARIDVFDELEFRSSDKGIHLQVANADLPEDNSNLVYQAAEAYLAEVGIQKGIEVQVTKHIPIAAGLGGGSSDAAATLQALSQLYPSNIDINKIGLGLGSDVSFFLHNNKAAFARGRGEVLNSVELPRVFLVLVNPGVAISANEAYQALNGMDKGLDLDAILKAIQQEEEIPYFNTLQPAMAVKYPEVARVLSSLKQVGLKSVLMSGSGSTCFGIADSFEDAQSKAQQIKAAHPEWWVKASHTV